MMVQLDGDPMMMRFKGRIVALSSRLISARAFGEGRSAASVLGSVMIIPGWTPKTLLRFCKVLLVMVIIPSRHH
jgi:hypothetical protein